MTAQTFSAVVRPASTFSTEKKKGGSYVLTSTAVTALGALTTASTISHHTASATATATATIMSTRGLI